VCHFLSQFEAESTNFPLELPKERNITIATGMLIHNIFQEKVIPVLNQIKNMNASLIPIKNNFYGNSVTVTGLLTGKDIIAQLRPQSLGDAVWMSHRILNDDGSKTLDDMTLEDMSHSLDCPVYVGEDSFLSLVEGLNNG
jgi:NifB/MoaA-like Fe-S oxidoreductase